MPLAPLRVTEAADSLAKASTPEPFSKSKTSNWVARAGGLPPYIQHIAHDLLESGRKKTESAAIKLAIGIVHNPPSNWGADARAAAAKAVAEWAAMRAKTGAKAALQHSGHYSLADVVALREMALGRLAVFERQFGVDGMIGLLETCVLQEAAWTPTMKRTASASQEVERHEVHDSSGQAVGVISRRKSYDRNSPDRFAAHAVNGERVSTPDGSRADALEGLRKHLEEAPARVGKHSSGKFLVARPASYSGPDTFTAYPTESSARYAAGLPEKASEPEKGSQVMKLGEMLEFDLLAVSGVDIPPLRRVQEARRADPFELAEGFATGELRDFRGEWRKGGATVRSGSMGLSHAAVAPTNTRPVSRLRRASVTRYEGGVTSHVSSAQRKQLMGMFSQTERASGKSRQPHTDIGKLYGMATQHTPAFSGMLHRVAGRLGAQHHNLDSGPGDVRSRAARMTAAVGRAKGTAHVINGPTKTLERAREKVDGKYAGDAGRLNDVVRGTIAVNHVDDVPGAISALRAELPKGWTITNPENRFVAGRAGDKVHVGPLSTGYRDVAVLVRSPQGFQSEVQITTTHYLHAKDSVGHKFYDELRLIQEQGAKRALTDAEARRRRALISKSREVYATAHLQSLRRVAPKAR